jgi:hypothetical protein
MWLDMAVRTLNDARCFKRRSQHCMREFFWTGPSFKYIPGVQGERRRRMMTRMWNNNGIRRVIFTITEASAWIQWLGVNLLGRLEIFLGLVQLKMRFCSSWPNSVHLVESDPCLCTKTWSDKRGKGVDFGGAGLSINTTGVGSTLSFSRLYESASPDSGLSQKESSSTVYNIRNTYKINVRLKGTGQG